MLVIISHSTVIAEFVFPNAPNHSGLTDYADALNSTILWGTLFFLYPISEALLFVFFFHREYIKSFKLFVFYIIGLPELFISFFFATVATSSITGNGIQVIPVTTENLLDMSVWLFFILIIHGIFRFIEVKMLIEK